MKVRLTQPLPQIGRVVPAGVALDAPFPLAERLVKQGKAVWVVDDEREEGGEKAALPSPLPPEVKAKRPGRRRQDNG